MSLSRFHPLVSRWFSETLGEPTPAQVQGWAAIQERKHTLIAAPTGSGKTLAAFLTALDDLFQEGLSAALPDEVRVVYVSPLKALSADIHKNLAEPRAAIRRLAAEAGVEAPHITAAVRTGDTTSSERAAMLRTPPHILVTTPESLYLLLTAERSREMLRTARTVIVDEIHAVIGTRRGAHLALTLERLQRVAERPLLRIGLSATQKPIEEVAKYLVGNVCAGSALSRPGPAESRPHTLDCAIVDEGHHRTMDLGVEMPRSLLEAVMSHEVWEEYYDRLTALINEHRTTLVFVNTRRMAERVARHLSERLGDHAVTAHHGSLSKENRLDAESRLKAGQLKALVATASLELGIDIGHVDLVCQLGSPHRIATFLQRVGRSGHTVSGTPKGRLFPVSRDDLFECAALMRAVHRGELDRIVMQEAPLDVLAQQLVAESSCDDYSEDELFALVRRAWPYRELKREEFDGVVKMLADGFATRRGRRSALIHRDEVNGNVRGRRGSRMLSLTSGGAIPEVADYRVMLEPEETFIGTINEDFAIESTAGDIFQLGNMSWQILQVGAGVVRVSDAKGAPPTIPFWLGEAPARSDELSRAVSDLRRDIDLHTPSPSGRRCREAADEGRDAREEPDRDDRETHAPHPAPRFARGHPLPEGEGEAAGWLVAETGIPKSAAEELVAYLNDTKQVLGVLPTQETLVLERFFDESGGMQLVLHAPFGSRINKAWGLALRKRFCRQFNFELQAAATEDGILLSLGPQHSFPLADVFRYLHPATTRDVLIQAFLVAPVFQTRWRWNTTISLAVPRNRGGRKVPPQLQRMIADDLMAAVFPDAAACPENLAGERELPDHPLVNQVVRDCLEEAMDFEGLQAVLGKIHRGELQLLARDVPEPSPLAAEILNAKPYAFLDDAPLEERRSHAVATRRASDPNSADDMGRLDSAAIDRVREEVRPDPRDADELHDALLTAGFLTEEEAAAIPREMFEQLTASRRVALVRRMWIAAERLPELLAIHPVSVDIAPPASRLSRTWTREEAIVELFRGRLTIIGPTTARELAASLDINESEADLALLALESEGVVLRGRFENPRQLEWCDRRLLARIHRYTLGRLRAEIEPVCAADFQRFLFAWQHVASRLTGPDGLRKVVEQLDGYELAAPAWERNVLPTRVDHYDPSLLDTLCLGGEVGWAHRGGVVLFRRENAGAWLSEVKAELSEAASALLERLRTGGAQFLLRDEALDELVDVGLVTADGFLGRSGRWSVVPAPQPDVQVQARALLLRYGVVFRRLTTREPNMAPWRDLARELRRLEARGEIRGGRFVNGMSGEQFALPEAVERLREIRRQGVDGNVVVISAVDPLNLTGILVSGDRIRAIPSTRIGYRDGVAVSVMEGDYLRPLSEIDDASALHVAAALAGRKVSVASGFVGRS
jgi:ATP-dependent Lhr-like helicase